MEWEGGEREGRESWVGERAGMGRGWEDGDIEWSRESWLCCLPITLFTDQSFVFERLAC